MAAERLSFSFPFPTVGSAGVVVTLSFETLSLRLRHAFGTSHSSTTHRNNALFQCRWGDTSDVNIVGYGESGLPPKKPKCYLADVNDCKATFELYCSAIEAALQNNGDQVLHDVAGHQQYVFGGLASKTQHNNGWFPFARQPELVAKDFPRNNLARPVFLFLLKALDAATIEPEQRAARSGIEAALFDCWCKVLGVSFPRFANLTHPLRSSLSSSSQTPAHDDVTRSFYTAALNDSIEEMKESTEFGLAYTSAIKIKLDSNVDRARTILTAFAEANLGAVWSIDANAAWTPDVARRYVSLAEELFSSSPRKEEEMPSSSDDRHPTTPPQLLFPQLYMIEQPWAAAFVPRPEDDETKYWVEFRKALNAIGVRVYADESIATAEDVERFATAGLVDGVNVKLEKAGGIRGALRAACRARELGLYVWIGTMVSSSLGCCQAAQVAVVADDSDVDGGLLAYPDQFDGGFSWRQHDGGILLCREPEGTLLPSQREAGSPPSSFAGFGVVNVGQS
ncbi:chloromuconate cycloisomerase, putative [Bodo saltans]|uniref:Chloromuconate cycloisomerase, putative n=1 Tax=Bodo saltans TaxID=75058 RepID=A0A0S4JNF9_BODSA|nr:chloromuconate cycloisomerase, putative [Bodo saltans]|eukprot:CUG91780.1 chloromuconate cycloisomerase, putative [Bodo saltans]